MSQQIYTVSVVKWIDSLIFGLLGGHLTKPKTWTFPWDPDATTLLSAQLRITINHDFPIHLIIYMNDMEVYNKESPYISEPDVVDVDVFDFLNNGAQTFLADARTTGLIPHGATVKWKIEFQYSYIGKTPTPPEDTWWGLTLTQWLLIGGLGVATAVGGFILYSRRRRGRPEVVYVERERERDRSPERRAIPYYDR